MTAPKAYLDTCIVSGLARGDVPEAERSSLLRILQAQNEGTVGLRISELAKYEIDRIPAIHRTPHSAIYELLAKVPLATTHPALSRLLPGAILGAAVQEDPLLSQLLQLLPDAADAEHAFQAARNGLAFLITVDVRTFIKHAAKVEALCDVRVITPVDFEARVLKK